MRTRFKILSLLFLASMVVMGQPHHQKKDKVETLHIAFISNKLELTPAEAEKFWPVYNEYLSKSKTLRRNIRAEFKKKTDNLTDAEAEALCDLVIKTKQEEVDTYKTYSAKLKTIIGVKKMVKLKVAEDEFKREMIKAID